MQALRSTPHLCVHRHKVGPWTRAQGSALPLSLLLESVSSASRELPAPGGMWSSLAPGLEGARDFHTWALCDPSWDTDVPCHVPLWQRGGPELNGLSTP